jgi:Holliday junction resolvasome RuvABC endonuclease subunit
VKSMVAGRGGAAKVDLAKYLSMQFSRDFSKVPLDATDAFAIALAAGISRTKVPPSPRKLNDFEPHI